MVTWTQNVSLDLGETTVLTFSVDVGDVLSGTVISNTNYQVESPFGISAGRPHTVTIVDPILSLTKRTWPDPPGSNREMTYFLTLFNQGSLATDLLITDTVPAGVTYKRGGFLSGNVVSWTLPRLDSFNSAEFTFTVEISDVANIPITNNDFAACSLGEGVCQPGKVLTSVVQGPIFQTTATIIPIAKKSGNQPITPTLTVRNVGNGNAISATVVLTFYRFSMTDLDVSAYFEDSTELRLPIGPDCVYQGVVDSKCRTFSWSGDISVRETITFALASLAGEMTTIGGQEGLPLLAGIIVTDTTTNGSVFTSTALAASKLTKFANVSVIKSAPSVIGAGQRMTYTIIARNSGHTTQFAPILTDVVPLSTTVVSISDGGQEITAVGVLSSTIGSWTLDAMGPGDVFQRSFSVIVDPGLVSGTQIVNASYMAFGYGNVVTGAVGGPAITTTVREVGLIDSYKEVSPTLVSPGPGNILTYVVHVVNSGAISLTGVSVYDWLPWESSTYQRDAVASAGGIISDIVSVEWAGNVDAFSEELITVTVLVDSDFKGAITNTAVISHADLRAEVIVDAVAYVTDDPVLQISKSAAPDPVGTGKELEYTIEVVNLGQDATNLVITDAIPANTTYVANSANEGGQSVSGQMRWSFPLLEAGQSRSFSFRVLVSSGGARTIVNDQYGVRAAGGFVSMGTPVVTEIKGRMVYLPMILRQ
jgi:uncharacterized repeat protein (TIGR01451 family)